MKSVFLLSLFLLLLFPVVYAQPDFTPTQPLMRVYGECSEYNVTVEYYMGHGCYDIKISATNLIGENMEILTPEGWKSTFFYVDNDFCPEATRMKSYRIRTDSSEIIKFQAKLRQDDKVIVTGEEEIIQDCPEVSYPDNRTFWLTSGIVILIILAAIVIYVRVMK